MIKNGFSLAETLICLMIISILTVFTIITTKHTDKTTRIAYSNAYEGLSTAFYNLMINRDGTKEKNPFHDDSDTEVLCNTLTTFISHTNNNCSTAKQTSDVGNSFPDENIQFISHNGYRFYISKKMETIKYQYNDTDQQKSEFYLVFIDINGKKAPNKLEYLEKMPSDIFAFALLDSGTTVPLGLPEYDPQYLLARLAYNNEHAEIIYAEPSIPYYMAKNAAWGCYDNIKDEDLEDEEKELKKVFYNTEVPFTMNEIIRDSLNQDSKIRITLPGVTNKLINNGDKTPQCIRYDYDNCFVVLDRYQY